MVAVIITLMGCNQMYSLRGARRAVLQLLLTGDGCRAQSYTLQFFRARAALMSHSGFRSDGHGHGHRPGIIFCEHRTMENAQPVLTDFLETPTQDSCQEFSHCIGKLWSWNSVETDRKRSFLWEKHGQTNQLVPARVAPQTFVQAPKARLDFPRLQKDN